MEPLWKEPGHHSITMGAPESYAAVSVLKRNVIRGFRQIHGQRRRRNAANSVVSGLAVNRNKHSHVDDLAQIAQANQIPLKFCFRYYATGCLRYSRKQLPDTGSLSVELPLSVAPQNGIRFTFSSPHIGFTSPDRRRHRQIQFIKVPARRLPPAKRRRWTSAQLKPACK